MRALRSNDHSVSQLSVAIVWSTKYRYHVLKGVIQTLKGVVSKVNRHLGYSYYLKRVSHLVKKLKGRSSIRLDQELPQLKQKYRGRHFWRLGYNGY